MKVAQIVLGTHLLPFYLLFFSACFLAPDTPASHIALGKSNSHQSTRLLVLLSGSTTFRAVHIERDHT